MSDFDIGLSHRSEIGHDLFDDFINHVSVPELRLAIEERQEKEVYAALEWLIPTAVIIFISKSYFDAFLKEMGKEHYHLLKNAIKGLGKRLLGPTGPRFVRITSGKGKVPKDDHYSLVFSVVADVGVGKNIKLLIQRDASQLECEELIDSFIDFLDGFHNKPIDIKLLEALETCRGRTILVAFNRKTKTIEEVII